MDIDKFDQMADAQLDALESKYGLASPLALAIDVLGLALGVWLLLQASILLTIAGIPFTLASAAGLLNKTVHGGGD